MRLAVDRHLGTVWTALPVKVLEDSDGHICKLQSTIKGWHEAEGGGTESIEIPYFGSVPINFPAGGGLTATHPIKKDDEGLAIFSSRCIDGWWDKGGIQEEPYRRRHSLSDAIVIPGVRNKPRQLDPPPSTNSYQIRTDDGKFYIELHQDGTVNIFAKEVNIHSPRINMDGNQKGGKNAQDSHGDTRVEIKGSLHATRDIDSDQNITAMGTITGKKQAVGGNISMTTHRHMNVQAGMATSGPPRPGS